MDQKTITQQEHVQGDEYRATEQDEHAPEVLARAFFVRITSRADIRDLLSRLAGK